MSDRFTIKRFTYDYDVYDEAGDLVDSTLSDEDETTTDLRGAIDAYDSDCWDNVDERSDCIICYPADSQINYQTGVHSNTHVVIEGKPQHIARFLAYVNARRAQEEWKDASDHPSYWRH